MKPDVKEDPEQDFEEFAKRWPDLFKKSQISAFGVGRGWHDILDILCGLISCKVENEKATLAYALNHPGKTHYNINTLKDNVEKAIDDLPIISDIKEKYGGLRIHIYGGSEEVDSYITFAESMSSRVCEVCGSPGTSREGGWIKTLCDEHHAITNLLRGTV